MKTILAALAGVALLAAPLAAEARGGGGGGFHGGGGYHGGGWGGYHGGYGGYHYGYGGWGWAATSLGFVTGAALASPAYWGGYYGYYGPAYGYYGPAYPPAVYYPGYAYPAPRQYACGQWVWDQGAAHYNWVPGACAAPPVPAN